jgi:hypothetical protein
MKNFKLVLGLVLCLTFLLSVGGVSNTTSANAGYYLAKKCGANDVVQNGAAAAGGAAGWLGAVWCGAKIGGKCGAIVGGPVGIIVGCALGAM